MKLGVQLNPQVSIDKPANSLMSTLLEQVGVADQSGFNAFSMGEHYNILGLQRLHQVAWAVALKGWKLSTAPG